MRIVASTASPAQRLVTIAKRPSSRAGDARKCACDLPVVASEAPAAHWHDGQISRLFMNSNVNPRMFVMPGLAAFAKASSAE
jgi:hypothetical protein